MELFKTIDKTSIDFWEKKKVPQKVLKIDPKKKMYYFLDGPPYATGYIHLGTALNKILKDYYIRFKRMQGFNVWCQPGYDTHGLPIENKVEKKLDFREKDDIEKFGIEKFNKECKKFATEFIDTMNEQFNNLGVWMWWDNPYLTLNKEYIEGAWFTFKKAFEKGLLYKGKYPVHVCPQCETAVAYNEIEYRKLNDPGVYVKFKAESGEYFIIYTTTPWTLPSNTGIMANPSFDYAKIEINNETWIVAEKLVESLSKKINKELKVKETVKGSELEGIRYENPLEEIIPLQKNVKGRVILSKQFVNLDEGTGLVHTAPGHGKEDFKAGTEAGLDIVSPLDLSGKYTKGTGKFEGRFVKEADQEIIAYLKEKNYLVEKESVTHDYPICWRCKSPLLFMCVPQWFFKVSAIQKKLIKENSKVTWVPDWAGKRFEDWLESLGDWPISRQRYWGTPLPIWECSCGEIKVLGSSKELPKDIPDLHRPHIDKIKLKCKCGKMMSRIPDVLDVWFDSGVAPWASLGYPNNKKDFKKLWPVKFELEGSDQFRGWWNSQIITSVITFDKSPFEKVLFHGMVLDVKGKKMSKSLGNIVAPEDVIKKYNRDMLRLYLLSYDPSTDLAFSWNDIEELSKTFILLNNIIKFSETCEKSKKKITYQTEDKWILSKLNSLIKETEELNNNHLAFKSLEKIRYFILEDLSRTYIKIIRNRTKNNDPAIKKILDEILENLLKILSPAVPHTTEYYNLKIFKNKKSIHEEIWPAVNEKNINKKLENQMKIIQNIIQASNALRLENSLKLKYPLNSITISGNDNTINAVLSLKEILKKMTNTKGVKTSTLKVEYESIKLNYKIAGKKYGKKLKEIETLLLKADPNIYSELKSKGKISLEGKTIDLEDVIAKEKSQEGSISFDGGKLSLDTNITPELKTEWLVRELIRSIQETRKKSGLTIKDKVSITLKDIEIFERYKNEIESATDSKIKFGKIIGKKNVFEFEGKEYSFGIKS